ncbi:glycosyltransferase family 4 protein [Candidatus Poribacteria bacterium]|nr:glycosyltransferase family 4 protein [Candidatus Poribacteria bacterium]
MKLFLITSQFPPIKSCISDYLTNLCLHFKWKSEVDPCIITSFSDNLPSTQVTDDGVYIFRVMENWGISEVNRIIKLIKKENPEIIHIIYDENSFPKKWVIGLLPFIIKKFKSNLKVVTYLYDFDQNSEMNNIGRLVSSSDIIIVNNDKDFDFILTKFPDYQKKLNKIYNRPHIAYNPTITVNREEVRKRLKVEPDGKLLIYFGFINREKRLDVLLRALRQVLDHGYKIKFLIIGDTGEDKGIESNMKYQEELKKLAAALSLDSEIFWAGYCSSKDISMSLLSSDLAILPFSDGVSGKRTSFWSALDHGIPTITTHINGHPLPEGLQNRDNVILVTENGVEELADIIIKCIEEPDWCKQIGEKGKKMVNDRYSWENMIKELVSIYKEG